MAPKYEYGMLTIWVDPKVRDARGYWSYSATVRSGSAGEILETIDLPEGGSYTVYCLNHVATQGWEPLGPPETLSYVGVFSTKSVDGRDIYWDKANWRQRSFFLRRERA